MRAMIRDVQNAATETNADVVLCGNYTKAVVRSELTKGIGASELFNTLRSVLTVKHGESPSERQLIVSKMSFLGKEVTPIRFTQDENYRIKYQFNSLFDTSDDDTEHKRERLSKGEKTEAFLRELLEDGPMDSNDVKKAVQKAGYSMTTVNRVKDGIVIVDKQSDRSSIWRLR